MVYDEDAATIANKLKQKFPDFLIKILDFDNDGLTIEK
jgi:homoserine kinase